MINIPLLPWQKDFVKDCVSPELALIGGLGSGKTYAFCVKAITLAMVNASGNQYVTRGGLVEPTNHLVKTHLIPNLFAICDRMRLPYDWHASDQIIDLKFAHGNFPILLTSGENYERLIGFNWAFFGAEELDTSSHHIAQMTWSKGSERVRWGKFRQKFTTSTIEGEKFLQEYFHENPKPGQRVIHANTELAVGKGTGIDESYIQQCRDRMSPQEYAVRVKGQWGALSNDVVYVNFKNEDSPEGNLTTKTVKDFGQWDTVHIGMDFNVGRCSSIVHFIKDDTAYAVDEIITNDNLETIAEIKRRFPNRQILCYPDTSGDNKNYVGYETAIAQLRQAGFTTKINSRKGTTASDDGKGSNPFVGDRIQSFNARLLNANGVRRYLLNKTTCPHLHKSVRAQKWISSKDETRKRPDKSNDIDHPVDAAGYFVYYNWPIMKSSKTMTIS